MPHAVRCALLTLASLLAASAAGAATAQLILDKPLYRPGETVTILFVGDSEGGVTAALNARLRFDPAALLAPVGQTFVPTPGGTSGWILGFLQGCNSPNPGACYFMNMIQNPALGPPSATVDPAIEPFTYGIVTGIAGAPGSYPLKIEAFTFFGLTEVPTATLRIGQTVGVLPEPGSAALLALGLGHLAARRRRVRRNASRLR